MICPVCSNLNIERYKMYDGINKNAYISCVGYHCHNCNHIGSALTDTKSESKINKAFILAEMRFRKI